MSIPIVRLKVFSPTSFTRCWCSTPTDARSSLFRKNAYYRTCTTAAFNGSLYLSRSSLGIVPSSTFREWRWKRNVETVVPGHSNVLRYYSSKGDSSTEVKIGEKQKTQDEVKKPGLVQRFKQMYRDYWYVLVPVHLVTSIGWFGGFYYLAKSGVDVVALLESLGVSERLVSPLKDSKAGYIALSYAMYKLATPIRYTVTLGGTTLSIKYLEQYGYIKPIPPKEKLKEMYLEKKDNLKEKRDNLAVEFRQTKERLKERKQSLMEDYRKRSKKSEDRDKQA